MWEGKIIILGNISKSGHGSFDIHDTNGISPTLRAECHGNPPLILVYNGKCKENNNSV